MSTKTVLRQLYFKTVAARNMFYHRVNLPTNERSIFPRVSHIPPVDANPIQFSNPTRPDLELLPITN